MTAIKLRKFLGWCTFINMIIITVNWMLFLFAHDFGYELWSDYNSISIETYDEIYISVMGLYEIIVIGFNLVPYIALRILEVRK